MIAGLPTAVVASGDSRLAAMLLNPVVRLGFPDLPPHWRTTTIRFRCGRPAGFQPGPWMVRSVRGAWGRTLKSFRRAGGDEAWQGFFCEHAIIGRNHVPKPYVLAVEARVDELIVVMTLFGRADYWRDTVIETMATALERGIGIAENSPLLKRWRVLDWHWTCDPSFVASSPRSDILMTFETPLKMGSSEVHQPRLQDSIKGLVARIAGLARWMGIEVDHRPKELAVLCDRIRVHALPERQAIDGFMKFTGGADRIETPVVGTTAPVVLEGIPPEIWPVLALGTTCLIGGHVVYGFGRYRI